MPLIFPTGTEMWNERLAGLGGYQHSQSKQPSPVQIA